MPQQRCLTPPRPAAPCAGGSGGSEGSRGARCGSPPVQGREAGQWPSESQRQGRTHAPLRGCSGVINGNASGLPYSTGMHRTAAQLHSFDNKPLLCTAAPISKTRLCSAQPAACCTHIVGQQVEGAVVAVRLLAAAEHVVLCGGAGGKGGAGGGMSRRAQATLTAVDY